MRMRVWIVLGMLALSAAAAAPDKSADKVGYRILSADRYDLMGGRVRRMEVRVEVPLDKASDRKHVEWAIREVVTALRHNEHALDVLVYRAGEPFRAAYTVARGTWAPNGEWGDAIDGLADPLKGTYRLVIEHAKPAQKK